MQKPVDRLWCAVLFSLAAAHVLAQTTGSIRGTVHTGGTPLPGVTVEARSSNLQGSRTTVTDAEGRFALTLLPPGQYALTVKLEGFGEKKQTLQLGLGQSATSNFELVATKTEEVTVTAQANSGRGGVELDRPEHDLEGLRGAADRPQLRLRRPARRGRRHRRVRPAQHVDHRLWLDRPRELLPRRRLEHDGRRVREPGQDAQLRVHPGGRVQGRRLRGRVRALDRRHRERGDQVRRQRVPRRRLRLLQRPEPPGQEPAHRAGDAQRHRPRIFQAGLRGRHRRLRPQGPPVVLRGVRPRGQQPRPSGHDRPDVGRHGQRQDDGQPLLRKADVPPQRLEHAHRLRLRGSHQRQRSGRAAHRAEHDVRRHRGRRRHGLGAALRGPLRREVARDGPGRRPYREHEPAPRARRQHDRVPGHDRTGRHRLRRIRRRGRQRAVGPEEVHPGLRGRDRQLSPRRSRPQGRRRLGESDRGRPPELLGRHGRSGRPARPDPRAAARGQPPDLLPHLLRVAQLHGRQPRVGSARRAPGAGRLHDLRAGFVEGPAEPDGQRRRTLGKAAHQGRLVHDRAGRLDRRGAR